MAEDRRIRNGGAVIIDDDGDLFRVRRALKALEHTKSVGAEGLIKSVDEAIADLKKAANAEPNLTIQSKVPLPGLTTDLRMQSVKTLGPLSKFAVNGQAVNPSVVTDCGVESTEDQAVLMFFGKNEVTFTLLNGTMREVAQSPFIYVMDGSGVVSSVHLGIKGSSKGIDYGRVLISMDFPF